MVRTSIMVKTGTSESEQLLGPIRDFEMVTKAHIVAGAYDIAAKVDTDTVYEVLKTASSRVQRLEGIADTKTCIPLDN